MRNNDLLIRGLRKQGRTYKDIQDIVECLPNIVANQLKFEWQRETDENFYQDLIGFEFDC